MKVTVENFAGRLDAFLSRSFPDYSRGYFQRLIKGGEVTVNGRAVSAHHALKEGDSIEFSFVSETKALVPEDIPLDIVHEDDDILVLNKRPGIVVHPAAGHPAGTLLNALAGYSRGKFPPLLVHRLDKDTSGLLLVAKHERAKNSLVKQFQHRAVKKTYLVAVRGCVAENHGRIEAPLGRAPEDRKKITVGPLAKKMAVTEFSVVYRSKEYSLLEARPITGRTHQIRSHLVFIGHPVLGDRTYGGPERIAGREFGRQMLHAHILSFNHPVTGRRVEFTAPPPEDMAELWKEHRKEHHEK